MDVVQDQCMLWSDDTSVHYRNLSKIIFGGCCSGSDLSQLLFHSYQPFTMTIVAQKTGFEVGVNGSHFFHFNYRVPLTREMSVDMHGFPFVEKIEYY